jgi:hypothetical protein
MKGRFPSKSYNGQACLASEVMSAFGGKADMPRPCEDDFCFCGQ